MDEHVKWAAVLEHVREVSLLGSADLRFWQAALAKENLIPAQRDGRAAILIVSAAGKFLGIPFRELSISVLLAMPDDVAAENACFLVSAFNSNRFFAFCERTLFSTPYEHSDVRMSPTVPAGFALVKNGATVLRAAMQDDATAADRAPVRDDDEEWTGRIFLPSGPRRRGRRQDLFWARLRGRTRTYPFLVGKDVWTLESPPVAGVFRALLDSHFAPHEWSLRADATHAKSKTYTSREGVPAD